MLRENKTKLGEDKAKEGAREAGRNAVKEWEASLEVGVGGDGGGPPPPPGAAACINEHYENSSLVGAGGEDGGHKSFHAQQLTQSGRHVCTKASMQACVRNLSLPSPPNQ